jgi:hypothetical protein
MTRQARYLCSSGHTGAAQPLSFGELAVTPVVAESRDGGQRCWPLGGAMAGLRAVLLPCDGSEGKAAISIDARAAAGRPKSAGGDPRSPMVGISRCEWQRQQRCAQYTSGWGVRCTYPGLANYSTHTARAREPPRGVRSRCTHTHAAAASARRVTASDTAALHVRGGSGGSCQRT